MLISSLRVMRGGARVAQGNLRSVLSRSNCETRDRNIGALVMRFAIDRRTRASPLREEKRERERAYFFFSLQLLLSSLVISVRRFYRRGDRTATFYTLRARARARKCKYTRALAIVKLNLATSAQPATGYNNGRVNERGRNLYYIQQHPLINV